MFSEVGSPIHSFYKFSELSLSLPGISHRVFKRNNAPASPDYMSQMMNLFRRTFQAQPELTYHFFTSRQEKQAEVSKLLSGLNVVREDKDLPTRENEENLVNLAVYHAFKAFKKCGQPSFVEEAALNVQTNTHTIPKT